MSPSGESLTSSSARAESRRPSRGGAPSMIRFLVPTSRARSRAAASWRARPGPARRPHATTRRCAASIYSPAAEGVDGVEPRALLRSATGVWPGAEVRASRAQD
jgi:hypothetical protein